MYPLDPAGGLPYQSEQRDDLYGHFAFSVPARAVEHAVHYSLGWINEMGVETIQKARQPLVHTIQREMRQRGFRPLTPPDSKSPIVTFVYPEAERLQERLARADVTVTLRGNMIRISPSFFNDENDIDRLLGAIGKP